MEVVVGRLGRPHGTRGEVTVQVRTDSPDRRFVPGQVFGTDPPTPGPLTLDAVRDHNGRLLLSFAGIGDRTGAETLRDVLLLADVSDDDEPDAWHVAELVGLSAVGPDGAPLGSVVGLDHGSVQDLLVVETVAGRRALVPFVTAIVPEVDVAGGRVVLDPPGGLLDEPQDDGEPGA